MPRWPLLRARLHHVWRRALQRALACLLLGLGMPAGAGEPATIEWYMIDLPPIQIATGELQGRGYTDLIRWRLIAGLPEYRHVLRIGNVQRILSDIRTKPNVCNPAFLRTPEREQFMHYADPLHVQFPNGAVILEARQDEFAPFVRPDGSLAVDALVEAAGGTLVVQSGRSYGTFLDQLIGEALQHSGVITLTSNRPVEAKLGLLQRHRADVALLYPYELAHHLAGHEAYATTYAFLPVEGNHTYTLNNLACSASPFGAEVIEKANRIIARERDDYFSAAYRAWIPESILTLHATHHRSAFGTAVGTQPLITPDQEARIAECLMGGGAWSDSRCEPSR